MAPHSSTLAWKIPWMEEPGRLQSMGSLRVGPWLNDFTLTFHFHALEKELVTHSSVLAWKIPRIGEPGGLPSLGSHRVGHDWSGLAAAAAAAGKNTEVGYHFLLQGNFWAQRSNPHFLRWQADSLPLRHLASLFKSRGVKCDCLNSLF